MKQFLKNGASHYFPLGKDVVNWEGGEGNQFFWGGGGGGVANIT